MRILIDSGSYHCLNVGDVAMLQAAVDGLRERWPGASIGVVTNSPDALAVLCPGVAPVPLAGRVAFLSDRFLGRADRLLPRRPRAALGALQDRIRHRWPGLLAAAIAAKRALALRRDFLAAPAYVRALKGADLVVASGAGVFTDAFVENAMGVLDTLEFAVRRNVPAAAFGQGIGPVLNPRLWQRMSEVFPRLALIGLRERRESMRLLTAIGARMDRVIVTGDDAIGMANRGARAEIGGAIGVNIRVAGYAGVDGSFIDAIRPALQRAATRLGAALVALPIAHHRDCHDGAAIRDLLAGSGDASSPVVSLDTPAKAIAEVSRCRVVVTGSYHAAVFALAQGLPVVAMAWSQYYLDKFSGLAELFEGGCEIVVIEPHARTTDLEAAIVRAWTNAPERRQALLRAAAAQIERAKEAYERLARAYPGNLNAMSSAV